MGGDTIPSSSSSSPSSSAPARDEFPSSSSSTSASSSPPTASDLARIAQQEALMDRLMERKLALLEAEYNACINAESSTQQTTAEQAAMHGYDRVGGGGTGGDREEEEEDFSPAWTQFKADMEEEQRRQQAEGVLSDEEAERIEESKSEESRLHAPLTSDKISSIKSVMSGIKLRPPPWAIGMPEEVWMARILERAGFSRRAVGSSNEQKQQSPQPALTDEERKRRKDKKKARKAKKAKEAAQQHEQHPAATAATEVTATATAASTSSTDSAASPSQLDGGDGGSGPTAAVSFAEDFETAFPSMSSPRSSPPPASAGGQAVSQPA